MNSPLDFVSRVQFSCKLGYYDKISIIMTKYQFGLYFKIKPFREVRSTNQGLYLYK